ncbi:MAG: chemotaxis protein CheW [Pseudomonadota bacterium]
MNDLFQAETFLPYMRDVGQCERSLHELNMMWRMIEVSAKMNCPVEAKAILPTMAATRQGFSELESELVESLAREKMGNVLAELSTKARYVIEIVVRNLYERTADVGFLATDRELCEFVAGTAGNPDAMRQRLRAYRSKYTVYDEIVLLDVAGNVLVQIDETTPIEGSRDPLIAQTLASDTYVETFRASDLRPAKRSALIYSRRVCHPQTGAVVGVLCLCFSFEEEMARIFLTHRDRLQRSNMLLLDATGHVIASADPLWIPLGAKVPVNREGTPQPLMFAGREYLVRTFTSPGYQGYPGPDGWQGQVMIPLDVAFGPTSSKVLSELDPVWADGLLSHARSFCPPLFEIMEAANMIRRVVWNGQVMSAGRDGDFVRLQTILEQISETGARSNELFSNSIRDLFETVLASGLRNSEFISHLLVDLLDRNLYERADDCRWWALSSELRTLLAGDGEQRVQRIGEILQHINGLYTVYTTIVVYDAQGTIVASSRGHDTDCIDDATLERVQALRTEQDYYVTPFEPCALYGGQPTYVYHAAIRHPAEDGRVIGGIGIVFDAGVEFDAMLRGALGGEHGMQAYFVDRSGTIIASTDPTRPIGQVFDLDASMLKLGNGESASHILTHDEHYAIAGCTVSHGYREFKVSDGYRADVVAVVIESFGAVRSGLGGTRAVALPGSELSASSGEEYATFFVGEGLFAIAAADVREAQPAGRVTPVSMGSKAGRIGVLTLDTGEGDGQDVVWVFDLGVLLHGETSRITAEAQVVVIRQGGRTLGLLVGELHGVAKFESDQIVPTPIAQGAQAMFVKQVVSTGEGGTLIQIVDTAQLFTSVWREV